jgi:hypothetical protein
MYAAHMSVFMGLRLAKLSLNSLLTLAGKSSLFNLTRRFGSRSQRSAINPKP